jgi:hypothetical protein
VDNILNEYILEGKTILIPILCKLFNVIVCTIRFRPILQLKKSEKLSLSFTLDLNLEYIDLIRFKSFPVTPHLANFSHNFSDFFSCNIGLVQGESLFPFVYAMYVNDIEIELIKQGCQSYELKMLKFNYI